MAETFLYLTTTGRKTGQKHKIEIWFVEHAENYYLCAGGKHNADWVQNIQQDNSVTFYLAEGKEVVPEQERPATGIILEDGVSDDERTQAKMLFDQKYNWSNGLIVKIAPE